MLSTCTEEIASNTPNQSMYQIKTIATRCRLSNWLSSITSVPSSQQDGQNQESIHEEAGETMVNFLKSAHTLHLQLFKCK